MAACLMHAHCPCTEHCAQAAERGAHTLHTLHTHSTRCVPSLNVCCMLGACSPHTPCAVTAFMEIHLYFRCACPVHVLHTECTSHCLQVHVHCAHSVLQVQPHCTHAAQWLDTLHTHCSPRLHTLSMDCTSHATHTPSSRCGLTVRAAHCMHAHYLGPIQVKCIFISCQKFAVRNRGA